MLNLARRGSLLAELTELGVCDEWSKHIPHPSAVSQDSRLETGFTIRDFQRQRIAQPFVIHDLRFWHGWCLISIHDLRLRLDAILSCFPTLIPSAHLRRLTPLNIFVSMPRVCTRSGLLNMAHFYWNSVEQVGGRRTKLGWTPPGLYCSLAEANQRRSPTLITKAVRKYSRLIKVSLAAKGKYDDISDRITCARCGV